MANSIEPSEVDLTQPPLRVINPEDERFKSDSEIFNSRLKLVYRNLTDLKQYQRCYEFILSEVTDPVWFKQTDKQGSMRLMDVQDRIQWLMKAKSAMQMVSQREQHPLNLQLKGNLWSQVEHLQRILQCQLLVRDKLKKQLLERGSQSTNYQNLKSIVQETSYKIWSPDMLMSLCLDQQLWSKSLRCASLMLEHGNKLGRDIRSEPYFFNGKELMPEGLQSLVDLSFTNLIKQKSQGGTPENLKRCISKYHKLFNSGKARDYGSTSSQNVQMFPDRVIIEAVIQANFDHMATMSDAEQTKILQVQSRQDSERKEKSTFDPNWFAFYWLFVIKAAEESHLKSLNHFLQHYIDVVKCDPSLKKQLLCLHSVLLRCGYKPSAQSHALGSPAQTLKTQLQNLQMLLNELFIDDDQLILLSKPMAQLILDFDKFLNKGSD